MHHRHHHRCHFHHLHKVLHSNGNNLMFQRSTQTVSPMQHRHRYSSRTGTEPIRTLSWPGFDLYFYQVECLRTCSWGEEQLSVMQKKKGAVCSDPGVSESLWRKQTNTSFTKNHQTPVQSIRTADSSLSVARLKSRRSAPNMSRPIREESTNTTSHHNTKATAHRSRNWTETQSWRKTRSAHQDRAKVSRSFPGSTSTRVEPKLNQNTQRFL